MKKILIYMSAALALISTACKKETKDVSLVVNVGHPNITLNGTEVFSTPVASGTFTDPGAVAYDDIIHDSVPLNSPVSNTVDLSTPGFYSVEYTYSNSNGYITYTAHKSRLVLVTPADPAQDISGVYERTANGVTANVVKHGTGLYTTDNVGGVGGNDSYIFDVYFGVLNDSTIAVPSQPNPLGANVTCEDAVLSLGADTSIAWVVIGSGFGTAVRTFTKQ